jgi:hypothetical protein
MCGRLRLPWNPEEGKVRGGEGGREEEGKVRGRGEGTGVGGEGEGWARR